MFASGEQEYLQSKSPVESVAPSDSRVSHIDGHALSLPALAPIDRNLRFMSDLTTAVSAEKFAKHFRATIAGLFVREQYFPALLDSYSRWSSSQIPKLSLKGGAAVTALCHTHRPILHYLHENDECMGGYIIPLPAEHTAFAKIPNSSGALIIGTFHLDPKDRNLLQLTNLFELVRSKPDIEVRIKRAKSDISISLDVVRRYAPFVDRLLDLEAKNSWKERSLRQVLTWLASNVKQSQDLRSTSQSVLLPLQHSLEPKNHYLIKDDKVFIVNAQSQLIALFSNDRALLHERIHADLDKLGRIYKPSPTDKFEVLSPTKSSECAIQFNHNGESYGVHEHAIERFAERAPSSARFKQVFSKPYSVVDLTNRLIGTFQSAEPVSRRDAVLQIIRYHFQTASYFRSENWIFVVTEDNVLRTCYEATGPIRRQFRPTDKK